MATRIDWRVSVTPIVNLAASTEAANAVDVLSADIKGTLGGGNSADTWAGNDVSSFAAGVCTCVTSDSGTTGAISSANGLWVKHTGYDYDAAQADNIGSTPNTALLIIKQASAAICSLGPGEAIYFPNIADATYNFADDGTPCAVEYAIFT